MTTLSPALTECIEAIDATLGRIERTLETSRQDHERFLCDFAVASKRLEDVKRGKAE